MPKHTYRPMDEAPRDGTPILAVCGGIEAMICWDDPCPGVLDAGWWHYDDDEMGASFERVRSEPTGWRKAW